jgi:hypothetical protein
LEGVEWASLALCKTTQTVSVTNGLATSLVINRTFGAKFSIYPPVVANDSFDGHSVNFQECWSPEAENAKSINNSTFSKSPALRPSNDVLVSETVVLVRWPWLALPLFLEALGLFVVLAAM